MHTYRPAGGRSFNGSLSVAQNDGLNAVKDLSEGTIIVDFDVQSAQSSAIVSASNNNEPSSEFCVCIIQSELRVHVRNNDVHQSEDSRLALGAGRHKVVISVSSSGTYMLMSYNGATSENTDNALTEFFSYVDGINTLMIGANDDDKAFREWYLNGTVYLVAIYDQAFTRAQAHAYLLSNPLPTTTTTTTPGTTGAPVGQSFSSEACLTGADMQGCSDPLRVNTVDSSGEQYHSVDYTGGHVLWYRPWIAGEEWKQAEAVSDTSIHFPRLTSGNYVFALRDSANSELTLSPGYRSLTIPSGQPSLRMVGNMVEYHGPHRLWIRPEGDADAWVRIGAEPSSPRHNPLGDTAPGDAPAGTYLFTLRARSDNAVLAAGELTIAS